MGSLLLISQTALELGFQYALVAMALFLSYRVLDIADLTTDGGFVLGAAVSVTVTAAGHPVLAIPAAMLAGAFLFMAAAVLNVWGFFGGTKDALGQRSVGVVHLVLAAVALMAGLVVVAITTSLSKGQEPRRVLLPLPGFVGCVWVMASPVPHHRQLLPGTAGPAGGHGGLCPAGGLRLRQGEGRGRTVLRRGGRRLLHHDPGGRAAPV